MKNKPAFIALLLIFTFAVQTFASVKTADKVRIVNISSENSASDEIEISVEIEYNFDSGEDGIVTIGFNSEKDGSFVMETPSNIKKGAEKITLKAKVKPADWKKKQLTVLTILTATPTGNRFTPSASDTKTFKFAK